MKVGNAALLGIGVVFVLPTAIGLVLLYVPGTAQWWDGLMAESHKQLIADSAADAKQRFNDEVTAKAHALIEVRLRDPESAQFSDEFVTGSVACGQVNAKNGFGGYTGRVHFAVEVGGSYVVMERLGDRVYNDGILSSDTAFRLCWASK